MIDNQKVIKISNLIEVKMKEIFKQRLVSVVLYGSCARGCSDEESDIDIMVIVDMDKHELIKFRKRVSIIANTIDLEHDVLVSIKLQDKDTFDKWQNTLPFFKNIKDEGVIIGA